LQTLKLKKSKKTGGSAVTLGFHIFWDGLRIESEFLIGDFMSFKAMYTLIINTSLVLVTFFVTNLPNRAVGIGGMDGSGGKAHVCRPMFWRDSAELFDFYEGRKQFGISVILNDDPVEVQVAQAIARVGRGRGAEFSKLLQQYADVIFPNKQLVTGESALLAIDDSKHVIGPEEDCEFEQIANYTPNNQILINENIWRILDNTNKAGLIVHEALYKVLRMYGATDSTRTRHAVAMAFAQEQTALLFEHIPDNALFCHSKINTNGSSFPGTAFYAYNDENGNLILEFDYIDGQLMLSRAQTSPGKIAIESLMNKNDHQQATVWSNLNTTSYDRLAGIAFSLEAPSVGRSKKLKVGFGNMPEIPSREIHCLPKSEYETKIPDAKE
jgi:hypothetical protein